MAEATTTAAGLEVRAAVRAALTDLPRGARVLVACSGGADSLALAAATAFVGPRMGLGVGGVTVDHGLQDGSAARARAVSATLVRLGLDPVESWHGRVEVGAGGGPEAAARDLRRRLLHAAARRHDAAAVLLGHTRDDQAETVLLGLARGSGARSLSGMRPVSGPFRRPLLGLARDVVRAAVPMGVDIWDDPHNVDDIYTRVRVRHRVLPTLEAELGPGVAAALARSADLLRADADALDTAADDAWPKALDDQDGADVVVLRLDVLDGLSPAVRTRLLRRAALTAGCPPTDLTAEHIASIESVVASGRGGAGIDLPGSVRATRRGARVMFATAAR
jgi:tRNA(Ile)-lysidine synthase